MPTIRGSIDWVKKVNFKTDKTDQTGTDRSALTPYPLQFANCVRIENNDAVYIFDEVGAGKTISAGLMLLHYLYNHPGQKALIITTNALARSDDNGSAQDGEDYQGPLFLKEWHESLKALGMEKRVRVVNNNYANINSINDEKKKSGPLTQYGMIIIDEAQEFLNQETVRYKNLVDMGDDAYTLTERVVFLSATPIKRNWLDLEIYREIAARLLHKPFPPKSSFYRYARENFPELYPPDPNDRVQQEKFLTQILAFDPDQDHIFDQAAGEKLVFDAKFPATRYFKDTVNSLTYPEPSETRSRERDPQFWEWSPEKGKLSILLEKISSISRKTEGGKINRLVIFVRLVKDEADRLGEELRMHLHFPGGEVKVITGSNSGELRQYTVTEKKAQETDLHLPQVLILTYQIAEAGVNLPAYNYVVNYHIPPYPSSLEQRFGRIDRLNSDYPCIHARYLLNAPLQEHLLARPETYLEPEIPVSWKWPDTNTYNFCQAVGTYLNGLLPYLPSRNALLTPEIVVKYEEVRQDLMRRLSIIENATDLKIEEVPDDEMWDELFEESGSQKKLSDRAKYLKDRLVSPPAPEQYEELLKDQNTVYYYDLVPQSNSQPKPELKERKLGKIQDGIKHSDSYKAFCSETFQMVLDIINGSGSAAGAGEDISRAQTKQIDPVEVINSCHLSACKELREQIKLGGEEREKLKEALYLTRMWARLREAAPGSNVPENLPEQIIQQIGQWTCGLMNQDCSLVPASKQNCLVLTLEDVAVHEFWEWSWEILSQDIYKIMSDRDWLREFDRRNIPLLVLQTVEDTRSDFLSSSCVGVKGIDYIEVARNRADEAVKETIKSLPDIDGGTVLQIYADAQKRAFRAAVTDWFQWMMKRYDREVTHRERTEMGEIMDGLYLDGKLYLNNHLKLVPTQDIVHAAEQRLAFFPQSVRKCFCDAVCELPTDNDGQIQFIKPVKDAVKDKMCRTLTSEHWNELRRISDFGNHLVELYAELFDKAYADMPRA